MCEVLSVFVWDEGFAFRMVGHLFLCHGSGCLEGKDEGILMIYCEDT